MSKNYIIVEDMGTFDEMMEHVEQNTFITYDTETTGLNTRKDKVIGIAVSGEEGWGYYLPLFLWQNDRLLSHSNFLGLRHEALLEALLSKKLIMHNASYDCRITNSHLKYDLLPALYCDTILLKHAVDEERPFGLKDIAKKIQTQIGLDVGKAANAEQVDMIDSIKANGGSVTKDKYELYKADMRKIGVYACADVDLTLRVFNYYSKLLSAEGLEKFFYQEETMPLLKHVTIPMETRGIPVDVQALESAQVEIQKDIDQLELQIQEAIQPHLAEFEKWYLWYKFPPRRSGSFAQALCEHVNLPLPKTNSGRYSLTNSNLEQLEPSPCRDFLLGGDYLSDELVREVQLKMFDQTDDRYMFNLSSKHNLKKLFFEILNEKPISTTDKGSPQVDHLFLASIKDKYDWMPLLLDYNKLNKLKGSYIDRFLDKHEDGVFYPAFFQHRTTSGRYGSDLQQLNRPLQAGEASDVVIKYNNLIRHLFIAGNNCKLIGADYSSLEVVVFADDAQEPSLLDMIREGRDFYSNVYLDVFNLHDKYSSDKKASNFFKKLEPEKRQSTKAWALGVRYGLKSFKLSKMLDISQKEADVIIDDYLSTYSRMSSRMDQLTNFAKKNGYVKSKAGRIRHLPTLKKLNYSHGDLLLDSLRIWKKYHENPKKYASMKYLGKQYRNFINNALNFPIQSMAASITNRACIAISKELKRMGLDAYICMQIHDEIVVRCSEKDSNKISKLVQYLMENTTKLSVPLNAEPQVGDTYGQIK